MAYPEISDENLRERMSGYISSTSVPPITNSTRSLLKSKLTTFEGERNVPNSTKSGTTTPPITMSFKCAKNSRPEKRAKLSSLEKIRNLEINPNFEASITSSTMEDQDLQSIEVEVARQGVKETEDYTEMKEDVDCIRNDTMDSSTKAEPIQTFVFFDIEATGLKSTTTKPRITELSFVAINYKDLELISPLLRNSLENNPSTSLQNGVECILPRVVNKLTICVNPMKMIMPTVSELTGLDNYNLECMKPFSMDTAKLINQFLTTLPQPACLVAHNGFMYDYPILNAEINRLGDSSELEMLSTIYCIDSLVALRKICKDNSNLVSQKVIIENPLHNTSKEIPSIPEMEVEDNQNEVHAHVETLEETQSPSVTSTPIKSDATSTSNFKNNYLLPITPDKNREKISFFHSENPFLPLQSPSTPSFEHKLIKRPKIESDFDREIVLTTRPPKDMNLQTIINHLPLDENDDAFITPDKPDIISHQQPPPPPRHSRSNGGKKRFVTHTTDLSEVVKAKKKLDFSTMSLQNEKPPSFSLPKLHCHWFGNEPEITHGAEHDCLALMRVCAYKGTEFINYTNSNATKLSNIKKMW